MWSEQMEEKLQAAQGRTLDKAAEPPVSLQLQHSEHCLGSVYLELGALRGSVGSLDSALMCRLLDSLRESVRKEMRTIAELSIKFADAERTKKFFESHFPVVRPVPPVRRARGKPKR